MSALAVIDERLLTRGHGLAGHRRFVRVLRSTRGAVTTISDAELMARIARRDEGALSTLYDRYAGATLALAERVLGDRAEGEDVVQEVFVRVWEDPTRYSEARGSVAAFVLSAARNRAIDRLRRRGARERATERASERLAKVSLPEPVDDTDKRVRRALDGLPEDQRRTIEMAYFDGLTQTELAQRLKQPLGTIKSRIRLGMGKLRDALLGVMEP
jgi:RNA polymerase sigma-70 factor, ECF subfamily